MVRPRSLLALERAMADPKGFLTAPRQDCARRPVRERVRDWNEVYDRQCLLPVIGTQAGRCMDCGIPFCHHGCPLGNLIPEWNDFVWRGDWAAASERLHATNNFPEFTGRLCPAPCEPACVLAINRPAVTIKNVEATIADRAWERGYATPRPAKQMSGKTVAVIGSGPAGLACAQQLTRAGHTVMVYERDDRIGGLLRYGIPEFRMEKRHLDRRLAQMRAEGTRFRAGVAVGTDLDTADLRRGSNAVVVAAGATAWRELRVPGRHVVIVGGGDTGADCLGTALRQGAASVVQLDINPLPGHDRAPHQPWPVYPKVYRASSAHQEARELAGLRGEAWESLCLPVPGPDGDVRVFSASTFHFEGDADGRVRALHLVGVEPEQRRPQPGTGRVITADLVLLALGFDGPDHDGGLMEQLALRPGPRGSFARDTGFSAGPEGVFVAGDAGRGASLIVWAFAEGRAAAAAVDRHLMSATTLPASIEPTDRPLAV